MKSEISSICGYKHMKIGDVVDIRRGASPRPIQKFLSKEGMPWVKIADATSDASRFISHTKECIIPDGVSKSVVVEPGVLIVSNSATPGLPKIMKITACVHDGWLVFSNFRGVTRDYLYYKFIDIRRMLVNQANGSVFQNLKTDIVREFSIEVPSIQVQNKIVSTLKAFDDKIELNNAINKNLEQQAITLYINRFTNNPSGLLSGVLGDIANITMGQSPKGSSYNETGTGDVFFQGSSDFGFRFPTRRVFTTEPKRIAEAGDILFSVRAPVGDLNVALERCCIGRGLCAMRSKSGDNSFLLYTALSLKTQFDVFNGTGTVFGSINKNSLIKLPVQVPTQKRIADFEQTVRPIDDLIRKNCEQIILLSSLRDLLLPKLMSGELEVSSLDI